MTCARPRLMAVRPDGHARAAWKRGVVLIVRRRGQQVRRLEPADQHVARELRGHAVDQRERDRPDEVVAGHRGVRAAGAVPEIVGAARRSRRIVGVVVDEREIARDAQPADQDVALRFADQQAVVEHHVPREVEDDRARPPCEPYAWMPWLACPNRMLSSMRFVPVAFCV